jgi:O-antigen/teichoic acid export membrane protein
MVFLRMALAAGAGVLLLGAGNTVLRFWLGGPTVTFGLSIWTVVVVTIVFSAWGSAFTDVLTIMDRIWVLVGFVMLNGLGTVLLTVALVPQFGVIGALLAYGSVTALLWSWAGVTLVQRLLRGAAVSVSQLGSEPMGGLW